jgi:hypothetical protein
LSRLTRSETLFEEARARLGLTCRRIRTAARPRPDYKVSGAIGRIVAEVKEVGANPTDKEYERQRATLGRSFGGISLGRLRPLVSDANKQLRLWAMRGIPGVVALYDTNIFQLYTEDHHVRSLFGDPAIAVSLGGGNVERPAQDIVLPTNQTLTGAKNQSVSAVLVIREVYRSPTLLALFHNPYARLPLTRGCAERLGIREVDYKIELDL